MGPARRPYPPRRVTLVTDELLGYTRAGGLGTATSFLAVALGRMGHEVELLYVGDASEPIAGNWKQVYDAASVGVRTLPRSGERVEPSYFERMRDIELTLQAEPPDVVVTQDLGAPAYTAQRLRSLGLAFEQTLFVVYCHGTRRWITDTAQKVRVLPGALAVSILEQASVELADVVVSPSAYLLEWMRTAGWALPPRSSVIPYFSRSAAVGEPPRQPAGRAARIERLAFFGRLEERKGLAPFAAALNTVEPELLRQVELEFVGRPTPAWPRERIEAMLSARAKTSLRGISFHTNLDQAEALVHLSRPGTLAVMPSLQDNSPNTVSECIEHGIPFIAARTGGIPELVAETDRERVLFDPTPDGIAATLRGALANGRAPEPARLAFDPGDAFQAWVDVIAGEPTQTRPPAPPPEDWVLLGAEDESLFAILSRAQAASDADIVTCGIRDGDVQRFFLGDPGGLGVLSNAYGTVALVRRSLLKETAGPIWPLLAHLTLGGASIVSIPRALVDQRAAPADAAVSLLVRELFEQRLAPPLRSLARVAAGLAAHEPPAPARRSWRQRLAALARRR
jgi:O-antigen biosynthesis protein